MDTNPSARAQAGVLSAAAPVMETVTLGATGAPATLPQADADALVRAGLATAPRADNPAIVLLAPVGDHMAGAVVEATPAVVAQLGERARLATPAEREIGGPNLKILTSL